MSEIVAIYGDGGCIRVNPSPIGAPWAVCGVDADGNRVWERTGVIPAADVDTDGATNNQSEFMAVLVGLEAMPDRWSGRVCTDSFVTLRRFRDEARLAGIPLDWRRRMAVALGRLGRIEYVLLDGHPTRAQLAAGVGKRGNPVSEHNVWCDKTCTATGRAYVAALEAPVAPDPIEPPTERPEPAFPTTYRAEGPR